MLKRLAANENKINYEDLSYKILFNDETDIRSHKIIFLKKYGTIHRLLEDLVTSKTTVNDANADQISLIINLMHGYKKDLLHKEIEMSVKKYKSWKSNALAKAKNKFQALKEIQKKK